MRAMTAGALRELIKYVDDKTEISIVLNSCEEDDDKCTVHHIAGVYYLDPAVEDSISLVCRNIELGSFYPPQDIRRKMGFIS